MMGTCVEDSSTEHGGTGAMTGGSDWSNEEEVESPVLGWTLQC